MSAAGLSVTRCTSVALMDSSSAAHLPHHRRRRVRGRQDEPLGIEHAVVRLHREDVLVHLGCLRIADRPGPGAAVLLVGPEHHAHGAPRPEAEPLHQPHGLPRRHRAASVVHRALPHVPRIDVAAHDDDLVRLLPSDHLGHHVARRRIGQGLGPHAKREHDRLAAILEPMQHRRVLHAERGRGDLRRGRVVARLAGVRAPDRAGRHRTDEACDRADLRRRGRTVGPDLPAWRRSR